MLFCCGTLFSNKIYNKFTLVKSQEAIELTNVFDFFKQKIFSDKENNIYQWSIDDHLNTEIKPNAEKQITVSYTRFDCLNNLQEDSLVTQGNESPSKLSKGEENFILDVKNTKKDIFLLYGNMR